MAAPSYQLWVVVIYDLGKRAYLKGFSKGVPVLNPDPTIAITFPNIYDADQYLGQNGAPFAPDYYFTTRFIQFY